MPAAAFAFVKIVVRDAGRIRDFYQKVLGLEQVRTLDADTFLEVMVAPPGAESGTQLVLYHSKANPPVTIGDGWGPLGFHVADVKAVFAHALSEGGAAVREPFRYGEVLVAFVSDPEGHQVELIGPA
jgi:lactoylglutathione lyase